ncbi:MAG: TRAP transporter permease [Geminicoccaceae bacterium]
MTRLDQLTARIEAALAATLMVMALLWLLGAPRWFGLALYTEQYMAAGLGLALCLLFLNYDGRGVRHRGFRPLDALLALIGLAAGAYLALRYPVLVVTLVERPAEGIVLATALVVLTIEGVRRATGLALALVAVGFMGLAMVGHLLPPEIASRPVDLSRLVIYLGIDTNAILGTPLRIAMQVILVFILLGQLLAITGGSAFFTDLATAAVGRFRGGAGKIAVFGSMLFGSISGSAVANVVGTGIVTIPLMKRSGFPAAMAGGIEAVASTGGQLMPPVVGAAVFLMAEFIEAPYRDVMLAALLPILLYYVALFFQVDLAAARYGLVAVPREKIPPAGPTLRSGWHFILPFAVFLLGIFHYGMQPENAALWALGTLLVSALGLGYKGRRARPFELLGALTDAGRGAVEIIMVTAGAGIVIGVLNLSGFAYALSVILITFAGGSLVVLLVLAAAVSILLGMGMPTVGVYVLLATLVAPALEQLGVAKLAAHLFVLYFGMMSMITPPVALAAYAAANLAGADPWRTSLYAVRLGWTAYIVPFLFVASPALLLIGAPALIAWTAITAVAGIWLVTVGFVGFALRPLGVPMRVLFAAIGLALFIPPYAFPGAPLLEAIGIVGGLGLGAWLWLEHRRESNAATASAQAGAQAGAEAGAQAGAEAGERP